MKITRQHIGKLVDNGDGSWVYQVIAVRKNYVLFYDFHGGYVRECRHHKDWRIFEPLQEWPKQWLKNAQVKEDCCA